MGSTTDRRIAGPAASDPRWTRILARDAGADGAFWYSVATTGVYCRPSCASRHANPANVQIHDTLEEAQRTGCRPCRRCRPDEPTAAERAAIQAAAACRLIEAAVEPLTLAALAAALGISPGALRRSFHAATGVTVKGYSEALRAARVRDGLRAAETVTAAAHEAGFSSGSRFYERSREVLGMTPSRFRAGGRGETLRFAIGAASLGAVLVASSESGVAAILLGDDADALARDLQDRFPRATLIGADADYEATVARVLALVEDPRLALGLPLDVRGTAFQRRVWQALRDIPAGQTLSYAELARRIGSPAAVRAVAGACAANDHAVAIPCHRVVRTDGALSGYAWGIERKRALLDRESGG